MVAPERNLPPDAQEWGRHVEKELAEIKKTLGVATANVRSTSHRTTTAVGAAARAVMQVLAVEQETGVLAEQIQQRERSDWQAVQPENPQHNQRWLDVSDGNVLKVWLDYGETERTNHILNPTFRLGVGGWDADGGTLAHTEDDKCQVTADGDPTEVTVAETTSRALTVEVPATSADPDLEEDDEAPAAVVGARVTASAEVRFTGPAPGNVVRMEVFYVDDGTVLATSGDVEMAGNAPQRITARSLDDVEPRTDPLAVRFVLSAEVPEFVALIDDVILEAVDYSEDTEQQYFDGSMPGILWQGGAHTSTSWWDGEPRWDEAQDMKLLQRAAEEASRVLEGAFTTSEAAPTPADGVDRPEGAYWTQINAEGAEIARWRWTGGEWVDTPIAPEFIPEAYVDFLAANEAFIELVQAGVVSADMFQGREFYGGTFVGATFRAVENAFELLLSGRGLTMLSREAANVVRRFNGGVQDAASIVVIGGDVFVRGAYEDGFNGIKVFNPETGATVRTIAAPIGVYSGTLATDGTNLFMEGEPSGSTPRIRVVTQTGTLVRHINIPSQALIPQSPTKIQVHSDGRLVLEGGAYNDIGLTVLSSTGVFQRRIPLNKADYGFLSVGVLHGDIYYEPRGNIINLWNINTGILVNTWQVGPGDITSLYVSGGILRVSLVEPLEDYENDYYVLGIDLETGSEVFSWYVPLPINQSLSQAFAVGEKQYASIYLYNGPNQAPSNQDIGELSVVVAETVQASMSVATGAVMFRNPRLRGTTVVDRIEAEQIHGNLADVLATRPINTFQTYDEMTAALPWVSFGTTAMTLQPTPVTWRHNGTKWVPTEDHLPRRITLRGNSVYTIGSVNEFAHLPGGLIAATLDLPHAAEVTLVGGGWMVVPDGGDLRAGIDVTGATIISESDPQWGQVGWVQATGGGRAHQVSFMKDVTLNAGVNTIRLRAGIWRPVQANFNYPVLQVIPRRWAH